MSYIIITTRKGKGRILPSLRAPENLFISPALDTLFGWLVMALGFF